MTPRLLFALLAGFGALIALTGVLGISQAQRAGEMQQELMAAQESYTATDNLLSRTRTDLYRIGMDIRDYLLDSSASNSADMKTELVNAREQIRNSVQMLESRMALEDREPLKRLSQEVEEYFEWMQPLLQWTPAEKLAFSRVYVRSVLNERRYAINRLAERIQAINAANLQRTRERLASGQAAFRSWLRRLTILVLLMSVLVAALSITWILRLERQAESGVRRAEEAEHELRRLSQQLVKAQEEERRALSRELHDQVGQQLTALRMEIASLGRIAPEDRDTFRAHLGEAKKVAELTMRTVRDLAMGLRPSMLDDLGLRPAIEWQAREFARRTGVVANVEIEGPLEGLDEARRTSLFRIVQEALTNIAKHAGAQQVSITVEALEPGVRVRVKDNGKGMDVENARGKGLGLIGIEERARDNGGEFYLESQPGFGTSIEVFLPWS
jgi:signal transduction histidine kinase